MMVIAEELMAWSPTQVNYEAPAASTLSDLIISKFFD